jgi:uncharacterized phiE125 gp8 family phage protein
MNLQITSQTTGLVVALNDLKDQCNISHSNTTFDALLTGFIGAATIYAEKFRNETFLTTSYLLTTSYAEFADHRTRHILSLPYDVCGIIRLPVGPYVSVDTVKYFPKGSSTLTVLDASTYRVSPGKHALISFLQTAPTIDPREDALQIGFTVGYGADGTFLPLHIALAVKMLAAHWYMNRESTSTQILNEIPMGFHALIALDSYARAI